MTVDLTPAHLDRPFDYLVPEALDADAQPGTRVSVRFAGRRAKGFVLERRASSDHEGVLAPLLGVVSPERVLTPEVARLCRAVADRWAGTLPDVLRLAVPPRHARVEGEPPTERVPADPPPDAAGAVPGEGWARYRGGDQLLTALRAGRPAHAVWAALPGEDWPARTAELVAAAGSSGGGVLVVVPDARDVARCAAALERALPGQVAALTADLGPAERYRRFLSVVRGRCRVVVGTRAAAFAPVADLRLCLVWDDGDDSLAEPRAPYPHARDVLLLRAHQSGCALVVGGTVPSVEAVGLLDAGWARAVVADRETVRRHSPRLDVAGSDEAAARDAAARVARLPELAFRAVRESLAAAAPVLVQVPRRGYQAALTCLRCRTAARCPECSGPLQRPGSRAVLQCTWCARPAPGWTCPECGSDTVRAAVSGDRRTAEEIGRAFPDVPVVRSGGEHVVDELTSGEAALVVATPGAEPRAPGGYGAVLLLDAWSPLGRPDLRAAEDALRRWVAAATLARPSADGGRVVLVGADAAVPAVQALVRWDPLGFLHREAEQRGALGFPPATRMAAVEGPAAAVEAVVDDLLALDALPGGGAVPAIDVLGPVPLDDVTDRTLLRVPRERGGDLAAALAVVQRRRSMARSSARASGEPARVRLDPTSIG